MAKAEEMFLTGRAPYPIERTLLTTGLVAAAMQSLAAEQKRLETPHLAVRYHAPRESCSGTVNCAAAVRLFDAVWSGEQPLQAPTVAVPSHAE